MWLARDKDKTLSLFVLPPISLNDEWVEASDSINLQDSMALPQYLFPEVTFENSPIEVDLILK